MIDVLFCNKGVIEEVRINENSNSDIHEYVGGYWQTYPITQDILVICDEDGINNGKQVYAKVQCLMGNIPCEYIHGDFLIVGREGAEFRSLTEEEKKIVKEAVQPVF